MSQLTSQEAEALVARYTTRIHLIDNGLNRGKYIKVEILRDGERTGTYQRNYSALFEIFQPFVQEDGPGGYRLLALYSPHYTATRLMHLPECEGKDNDSPPAVKTPNP